MWNCYSLLHIAANTASSTNVPSSYTGLSFSQQIEAFFEADVIVGPHGAGFTNMLWAADGAHVILFPMSPLSDRCYLRLPVALGFTVQLIDSYSAYYYGNFDPVSPAVEAEIVAAVQQATLAAAARRHSAPSAAHGEL